MSKENRPPLPANYIYVNCPLCGADDCIERFKATAEMNSLQDPEVFRCTSHQLSTHGPIVQCTQCGMIYNNPQPDPVLLEGLYQDVQDPLYLEESEARARTFQRSLNQLHHYIQPPGKLLDVGCYTGAFMQVAKQGGWDTSGVELSRWAAEIARNADTGNVYQMPLGELPLERDRFDVITLWDVMEHLSSPGQIVKEVFDLLKPGGVFALSTHMVDSMAAKLLGTKYPFFMDMHIAHFSRATITTLLENNGFQVLDIKPHRRILKTGYFLEKLSHKVPIGKGLVRYLSRRRRLAERFIPIGLLGLVNIFARKGND